MSTYTLLAMLTADAKQFVKGIENAKREMKSLQKYSQDEGKKFQNYVKNITGIGNSLTNNITKHAVVTTGILAGMVGTLGFKRLTGIDTAQAKLTGLGYTGEDVERIMEQVKNATK